MTAKTPTAGAPGKRMQVLAAGMLSLLQDAGRMGQHGLGLTTGGPMDRHAFSLANDLCGNPEAVTAIEITQGGLQLLSSVNTVIALCGAPMPLWINDQPAASWRSHRIYSGDRIQIGYCREGLRAYLAVAGGFDTPTWFGSTATVVRESIGGLSGRPLQKGDRLPCRPHTDTRLLQLAATEIPCYNATRTLRLIPGYQFERFPVAERERFFAGSYRISQQSDRMGYRLQGTAIKSGIEQLYSEGIVLGAVQIPGDGQPIVLMNDRQTIGGYPKLGAVLSCDLDWLAQQVAGAQISFTAISAEAGSRIIRSQRQRPPTLQPVDT